MKTVGTDDSSQNQSLMVQQDQTHKELITLALIKCSLKKKKKKSPALSWQESCKKGTICHRLTEHSN